MTFHAGVAVSIISGSHAVTLLRRMAVVTWRRTYLIARWQTTLSLRGELYARENSVGPGRSPPAVYTVYVPSGMTPAMLLGCTACTLASSHPPVTDCLIYSAKWDLGVGNTASSSGTHCVLNSRNAFVTDQRRKSSPLGCTQALIQRLRGTAFRWRRVATSENTTQGLTRRLVACTWGSFIFFLCRLRVCRVQRTEHDGAPDSCSRQIFQLSVVLKRRNASYRRLMHGRSSHMIGLLEQPAPVSDWCWTEPRTNPSQTGSGTIRKTLLFLCCRSRSATSCQIW